METVPLKIAMLSVHSCPVGELGTKDTGGMSVYIRELARELGKRGHWVDIYTRIHDPKDSIIIELGENARLIHLKAGDNGDMKKLAIYPYLADFAFALENFRKHDGRYYDVVHSHYWLSGRVGGWLKDLWGVPHVVMFHTLGKVKNTVGVGEDEPPLRLVTENEVINRCHRIIAATENEKLDLMRYYNAIPETVGVVPCGVNLELFKPMDKGNVRKQLHLETEKNILLYVGRIDPLKGIDRLLMASANLKRRLGFKLIIIGDNDHFQPELQRLKWFTRELGIQDLVMFAGRVNQEDLSLYYNAADVVVVPSYHESFGLVGLESLACGTPVVATKVGGLENIIEEGQNGYLVTDDVPHSMADKIELLLTKSEAGTNSPGSIRNSVINYSWSNIADRLIEEYKVLYEKRIAQVA